MSSPESSSTPSRPYRFSCKHAFLTYPQCPLLPEYLLSHLVNLLANLNPTYIAVAQESHDDGNLHLHVLILTERKMDFRSPRHFDVDGYHPNIQPARSVQDVYQYVTKGGNYKEYGEPPKPNQNPTPKKNRTFRTIIRECNTKQEYLDKIKEVFPYEWATKLRYFEYSGEAQFPEPKPEYKPIYTPSDFQVPPELQDWVNANIFTDTDQRGSRMSRKSLYICGPSRTGKTCWARSLGPHNYWAGNIDFTNYDERATYNIVDDIPCQFVHPFKSIIGIQSNYTVNPKYGKKKGKSKEGSPP
ncbi:uncharacterized protein LOC125421085 [Ziziphus jujuba]|uniref:Uncharacterized protein LOC125421085 n=1 Tax=Ziziphus jujuba TaxID=326968 RepID=A0ABM3ZV93_ZIZJJ|nr:uncharacterized protein LOC125421085 [Ziziphus jujuba]